MRARRVDSNHKDIIQALRALGCSVADTSRLGQGFPDAVVSRHGITALVEIKDGSKPPSARKLTPAEEQFRANWQGVYRVVESVPDAIDLVSDLAHEARTCSSPQNSPTSTNGS